MTDYENAIKRPFQDIGKFVIGALLSIIPVVNFIATGYTLNCAKTAMKKDYKLPEWTDWVNLFIQGLIVAVIGFIYMIPALIVLIAFVGTSLLAISSDPNSMGGIGLGGMGIGFLAYFVLLLVALYILPAAIMEYVKNNSSFGSAFRFGEIKNRILSTDYLIVWLVVLVYSIVVVGVLSIIPIIGSAIGIFAAEVTSMTLFGELYSTKEASVEP
ncbi:MAG: DUF4013 domain-containing protein [Candidatus Altiarchaeota archaeon]|nr:DUF4013 domain-containing protein [Candidatus Altiarchaeota archaeon]